MQTFRLQQRNGRQGSNLRPSVLETVSTLFRHKVLRAWSATISDRFNQSSLEHHRRGRWDRPRRAAARNPERSTNRPLRHPFAPRRHHPGRRARNRQPKRPIPAPCRLRLHRHPATRGSLRTPATDRAKRTPKGPTASISSRVTPRCRAQVTPPWPACRVRRRTRMVGERRHAKQSAEPQLLWRTRRRGTMTRARGAVRRPFVIGRGRPPDRPNRVSRIASTVRAMTRGVR